MDHPLVLSQIPDSVTTLHSEGPAITIYTQDHYLSLFFEEKDKGFLYDTMVSDVVCQKVYSMSTII
jgi:hypothetical protein